MRFVISGLIILALSLGAKNAIAEDSIKLLSWNVYMLPSKTLSINSNTIRAKKIVEEFLKSDYDVICVQELFDNKVRKYFCHKLLEKYPYQLGYDDESGWIRTNSGLYIFSKFPAEKKAEIVFSECDISDCFADKGAIAVEIKALNNTFTIINTHLQAGREKQQEQIRSSQLDEIVALKDSLFVNHQLLYVGDFNICDPEYVNQMYYKLKVYPVTWQLSSHSHPSKDYERKASEKKFLDYVMRDEESSLNITTQVIDIESSWRKRFKTVNSLSDHRALLTVMKLP